MHFEILVSDISGKKALDILVPNIINTASTCRIKSYKGEGFRVPKGLKPGADPSKRILLDNLPRLLNGYGKTFAAYGETYPVAVVVVCDLDDRCQKEFRDQLLALLTKCNPAPKTIFCFAVEEGEAWLFGDREAIQQAYPDAQESTLNQYQQDTICGTWEMLADSLYPGGAVRLKEKGWMVRGREKSTWAEKIAPHMDVDRNQSPSFCYFRDKLRQLEQHTELI